MMDFPFQVQLGQSVASGRLMISNPLKGDDDTPMAIEKTHKSMM